MRRDSQLLETILTSMQEHEEPTQCCKEIEHAVSKTTGHTWPEIRLHLALLKDMGLVAECTTPAEYRLTSAGYDVVESTNPFEQLTGWAKVGGGANIELARSYHEARHPLPPRRS
ncbi:hypothetical protein B0G81_2362 [Paraburkholderia sp. BL6665CI2N2]|uniref:hypothetical protein n=1 Tax=Paraburkholderia sp. BL6665CI2N2 TaxID=1938806 RepID=UPI0010DC2FB7|nr:hypothetical protein [Paraburkholderia sp. BL6665CI2N2]TDY22082.1 hypothetical protein B0G81_2362 [Paraburkholderia sp. BL6665CI2N2]